MRTSKFRTISILITVSLTALAGSQTYWLIEMYAGMNEQFNQKVHAAMERAAYEELVYRETNGQKNIYIEVVSSKKNLQKPDLNSIPVDSIQSISIKKKGTSSPSHLTGSIQKKSDEQSKKTISSENLFQFDFEFENQNKINMERYDSLLTESLLKNGISLPHKLSLKSKEGVVISFGDDFKGSKLSFEIPTGKQGAQLCLLEIENPNSQFFVDMIGIMLSSILILILLCLSFFYLLRTIFRQKSIEEIRRDFTHNITHELKTPIAVAYAANDALLNFKADSNPQKRKEYLEVTQNQLHQLSSMVEKILSMSAQEREEFHLSISDCSLKEIFQEITEQAVLKYQKKLHFNIKIIPENLTIQADHFHLSNIIGNIIDNAVKYSRESVTIDISARHNQKEVILSIGDNGIGIERSNLDKIFDKFYRVPTGNIHNVKGFGLGLYYTKLIVEKHKGEIFVESIVDKMTRFTIKLPQSW